MTRRTALLPLLVCILPLAGPAAAQRPVPPDTVTPDTVVPGGRPPVALALDTVRVTAASRASAAIGGAARGVEVLTAERIRALPARSVDEVLRWALGADVMQRSPALADLSLRGSSFEQVLVLVDGVRVSDAQTGHFDLDLAVPLDQVERIEVVRGPAATLYGADAMGGVVNVVTRSGAGASARAEYGSFGSGALAAAYAGASRGARLDAAGDFRRSDGHRTGTDYRIGVGRAALELPVAGRSLRADVGLGGRDFGADGFYGPYPSYERTRTLTASLAWRGEPGARLSLQPRLSLRQHHDDFVLKRADPAYYRNRHLTRQLGGELIGRYLVSPRLRLAAGGEAYLDRLESARLGDRAEGRAALLAELAAGRVGVATASLGARADAYEAYGLHLSPSAAAAWWPAERVKLRGSLGRALRTPTWTERYYRDPANVGDPALRPERAWEAEVGADAYPAAGARLSAAAFLRDARDLVDWARPVGDSASPWHTRNVNRARYRGLETELSLPGPLDLHWTARGSWLALSSSAEPGFTSKYALRPLVRSLSLAAVREAAHGFGGGVRLEQARRRGEPSHTRLDGRLSYRLAPLRVYLDVQNAADAAYPDITGRPAPGRALLLGAEVRR